MSPSPTSAVSGRAAPRAAVTRPAVSRPTAIVLTAVIAVAGLLTGAGLVAGEVRIEHEGLTLNANLTTTDGWPAGPVVVLTHGTLAHRGMELISGLQGALAERGLSSLAVNLSLGQDDRAATMVDCAEPHRHRHQDAAAEVGAWVHWLKGQGAGRVALFGHSRGGNQVAHYAVSARNEPALVAVYLLAPQTWTPGQETVAYQERFGQPLAPWLTQAEAALAADEAGRLLGPLPFIYCDEAQASAAAVVSYYGGDAGMDTPALLPDIAVPVLVIAGSEDDVVSGLAAAVTPLADGERVRLAVIDGADHFFRDLYLDEVADLIAADLAALNAAP